MTDKPKIRGQRQLEDWEFALLNEITDAGEPIRKLCDKLRESGADPRFLAIAQTQMQMGFFAMKRAVSKNETFA